MSRFKKVLCVSLLIPFISATTLSATGLDALLVTKEDFAKPVFLKNTYFAQNSSQSGSSEVKLTSSRGMMDGEMHAERQGTWGKFAGGLAIGLFTGPLGPGIGYFLIGPTPMDGEALNAMDGKGSDYQLGFLTGWNKKTKAKKRSIFLVGGLLGAAVAYFILIPFVYT